MNTNYSIEPEMSMILSDMPTSSSDTLLGGFLGFLGGLVLPNPISWLLEPFIQLWTIQAEIKRIRLKEKQITLAADVAKRKIESQLEIELNKLKTQCYCFNENVAEFERMIQLHDNQVDIVSNGIERLHQRLDVEKNTIAIVSINKSLQILYESLSGNFMKLCDSYDRLLSQVSNEIESVNFNNERLLGY